MAATAVSDELKALAARVGGVLDASANQTKAVAQELVNLVVSQAQTINDLQARLTVFEADAAAKKPNGKTRGQ